VNFIEFLTLPARDRRERLGEFLGGLVQDRDELVNYTPPANRTTLLGDRSQTPASVQFVQDYGDFLPVLGEITGAMDLGQELSKDDPNYPLAAALGLGTVVGAVPVVGDTLARGIVTGAERLADAVPSDVKYATRSLLEGDLEGVRDAFYEGGVPVGVGADAVFDRVRSGAEIKARLEETPNVIEYMTGEPYVPMSNTSNLKSQKPIALLEHESVVRPTGETVSPVIGDFADLEGRDVLAIVGDQTGRHDILSVGKYDLSDDPQRSLAGFEYIDVDNPLQGYAGAQSATSSKLNEALESTDPFYMSFLMGEKSSDFALHTGETYGKMVRKAVEMGDIEGKDLEYIDNAIRNIGVPELVKVRDADGNIIKKADGTPKTKSVTTYPFRDFTSVAEPEAILSYMRSLPTGTQRAYFLKGLDKTNLYKRGMPKVHDARLAVADEAQMGMDWGTVGYRGFTPDLQRGLLETTPEMSTTYDTGVAKIGPAVTFLDGSRGVPANLAFADLSAAQREKGTGGGLLMNSADYKVYESSPTKAKQPWRAINTDTVNTFIDIEKTQGRDVAYAFAQKVLSEGKVTNALIKQAKKMSAPQWVVAMMVTQQALQEEE